VLPAAVGAEEPVNGGSEAIAKRRVIAASMQAKKRRVAEIKTPMLEQVRVHFDALICGVTRDRTHIWQLLEPAGKLDKTNVPAHLTIHGAWQSDPRFHTLKSASRGRSGNTGIQKAAHNTLLWCE
jgi:hypothetical protein